MQVKGQAISPPHNYPVLKQESGIDWPGSLLCDWTCRAVAWLGRALLVNSTHGPCIGCAEGLLFSPPVVHCAGEAWATPLLAPVWGGGFWGVPPSEVRRSIPPTAAAPRGTGVGHPTLSDQGAPALN